MNPETLDSLNQMKVAIITALGALTGIWGWFGWLLIGWVICMVLDYITGTAAAMKAGTWSSQTARDGIWHKMGMCFVVVVAGGMDLLLEVVIEQLPVSMPIDYPGVLCPIVLVWYIVTEMGSVLENAVKMGATIPGWLTKLLDITKDVVNRTGEDAVDEVDDNDG